MKISRKAAAEMDDGKYIFFDVRELGPEYRRGNYRLNINEEEGNSRPAREISDDEWKSILAILNILPSVC